MPDVVDRDLGYRELLKGLGDLGAPGVDVGILQDKGGEYIPGEEITLAGYAAVNEFGSEDGHVPERSFLRSTVDERREEYQAELDKTVGVAIDSMVRSGAGSAGRAMEQHLGRLGLRAARDVQAKIRDLREPENADSTLAAKYPGTNPLIDTGRMRQSISHKVDMGGES